MTGYLSRIAHQSGLRFSSAGAVSSHWTDGRRAGHPPRRIDREEIVIMPPPVELKRSEDRTSRRSAASDRPAHQNSAPEPDREQSTANADEQRAGNPSAFRKTASTVAAETFHLSPEPESTIDTQALSSESIDETPQPAASHAESAEIVESVMVEPGETTGQPEKHSPQPDGLVSSETTAPGKPYFTKTAEIIGGRAAEPAEVQTILLREIQQWAAGGSTAEAAQGPASDKTVESVTFSSETIETEAYEQRVAEPEAGVVRIGEKRLAATVPQEASTIDEQHFDLSIGTISVVVEGDQRPPQPAAPPRPGSRQEGHDTRRRRSRLGRNYL